MRWSFGRSRLRAAPPGSGGAADERQPLDLVYPLFEGLRDQQQSLDGMFAVSDQPNLKGRFDDSSAPEFLRGSSVSGAYFSTLRLTAGPAAFLRPGWPDPRHTSRLRMRRRHRTRSLVTTFSQTAFRARTESTSQGCRLHDRRCNAGRVPQPPAGVRRGRVGPHAAGDSATRSHQSLRRLLQRCDGAAERRHVVLAGRVPVDRLVPAASGGGACTAV